MEKNNLISIKPNLEFLRKDIESFIKLVKKQDKDIDENTLKYIAKGIQFQKEYFMTYNEHGDYYNKNLVFNLLLAVQALEQKSVLNFYYYIRSYIENYIRSILSLDNNDETGVNELFRRFSKIGSANDSELKIYVDYIKGIYKESCDYVHSNIKANIKIYLYYKDVLELNKTDKKKLKKLLDLFKNILINTNKIILISNPDNVESLYYKKYEVLKFLIGSSMYKKYHPTQYFK